MICDELFILFSQSDNIKVNVLALAWDLKASEYLNYKMYYVFNRNPLKSRERYAK